ncbi:type II toxin-antitoxin system death-on-curing family toxin [Fructobacillus papyrifericola]|uniref:Type II toxin-antitoxin system death-on-curing family toxin n=1 Tax=Fructobacillus papyrifericola TaxID=2713172 RepID=A0ABS5QSG9_9LACO|nr:type II toxin-antitoxin system death-on-curing family toxin [Fructobacillus papyrifericola]MBS9336144.1 type II toxin-antitoxin system death-on-curing family toxin [Fructobacillus papyrifericola]
MPIKDLSGVLLYAHDTEQQFAEFKSLFLKSGIVEGVSEGNLTLVKKFGECFLDVDNGLVDYHFILRVLPLENFTVDTMRHINQMAETILKSESLYGLKDQPGLEQILALSNQYTFGHDYHPTVIDKASYLWYAIASKQLFHNGNKRTALLTGLLMLEQNFIRLHYKDTQELYDLSLRIAQGSMSREELQQFILKKATLHLDNIAFFSRFYGPIANLNIGGKQYEPK